MAEISTSKMLGCEIINTSEHAERYIGGNGYAKTQDFKIAELARMLDMSIRDLVAADFGANIANEIRYKGWGQLIAMAYLAGNRQHHRDVSEELLEKMKDAVERSLDLVKAEPNPIGNGLTVTKFTKPALMNATHPDRPSGYLDWQLLEGDQISNTLKMLNGLVEKSNSSFELKVGSILLMVKGESGNSIFDQIWNSDFKQQMASCGYHGLDRPLIEPHLTLVDSQEISKLRDKLESQSDVTLPTMLAKLTVQLAKETNYLKFKGIEYTFSTEFSTYTDVIVAPVESPVIDRLMKEFRDEVKNLYGLAIKTKPIESFHLTLGGTPRPALALPRGMTVDRLIKGSGASAQQLQEIWKSFCESLTKRS